MIDPELNETSKVETTVRHIDTDGRVTSETVTVVTSKEGRPDDLPTGMYL